MSSSSRKRNRWDSPSDEKRKAESLMPGESSHSLGNNSKLKSNSNTEYDKRIHTTTITSDPLTFKNLPCCDALTKHNPLLRGCRSVYIFDRIKRIDEGTYGIVWKAMDRSSKEIVALKQIKFDPLLLRDGFPIAALREISVLLSLSHPNIVTVREMVVGDTFDKVFMVMEVRLYIF
jgi:cell division cycle 2-like protein